MDIQNDILLQNPLPHNKEAEQSVLGSMLVEQDCVTTAFERLVEDDFYIEANKKIFSSMHSLFNRNSPIDLVTVSEALAASNTLDAVGGIQYLSYLATSLPTTANIVQHIDIICEKALRRRLIHTANNIIMKSYNGDDSAQEVADSAGKLIFDALENNSQRDMVPIRDLLLQTYDNLTDIYQNKGKLTGAPTGFIDLDKELHGLQKSDLILIAGRPGMGKTSFALNIAANAAIQGNVPVAIFSLEMSGVQLVSRLISSEMLIESNHLRSGELDDGDWEKIAVSLNSLGNAPIYISDTTNITVSDIRARCRRLKAEKGLGLIVIDYLQLMSGTRAESRQQEVSDMSRSLKILAKELNVPIITLSQLSRAPDQRKDDHRPKLSDLRESGAIEQDADIVLFLYRDEIYNPDTEQKNIAECIIAKHRNGSTGNIKMVWAGQYTKFMNLDKQH